MPPGTNNKLRIICEALSPDNIEPRSPKIAVNNNIGYGIMNPVESSISIKGNSVLLGKLYEENNNWADLSEHSLDGSYALFRENQRFLEIVSDQAGTRTIWYYHDEVFFLASTSQRAIVMFLGTFEFDKKVIPWVLSTGYPGPAYSWDRRIKRVPVNSAVKLDKKTWDLIRTENKTEFTPVKLSDDEHEERIRESLKKTFSSLDIDFTKWVLPLSGGYDSRGILCLLKQFNNIQNLKAITWGLGSSVNQKGNDAFVARKLANALGVPHSFYKIDYSKEATARLIDRFILLGEGRVDHLAAYMDGFEIWKTLFEEGVHGVIRGDEGFGMHVVSSPLVVKKNNGCVLCSDYSNLKDYKKYGFEDQEFPESLLKRGEESLEMWRDRLYYEYRLPTILAALTDLKLAYVEVINPLLSRRVLEQVKLLPDHLRTERALFKRIVTSVCPKIPIAHYSAIPQNENVFLQKDIVNIIREELESDRSKAVLPEEFTDFVLKGLGDNLLSKRNKSVFLLIKSIIKNVFPEFLLNMIRDNVSIPMNHNRLAFRTYIIIRMNTIMSADAQKLEK